MTCSTTVRPPRCPAWLGRAAQPGNPHPTQSSWCGFYRPELVRDLPTYATTALLGEVERVTSSPEHGHNWPQQSAFNLGRAIAAGILPREVAEEALQAAGEAAHTNEHPPG